MESITIFLYFFIFLFGASIGSFLNVLIDRLPNDKTISGRSHCDNCKKQLKWYDSVPILSFLFLAGKCRYCHKKISWQYPAVEFITGLLFVFGFLKLGFDWSLGFGIWNLTAFVYLLLIISFLIVIFFSDLKYFIIPDKIIYPAIGLAFLYQIISNFQFPIFNQFLISNFQMTNFFFSVFSALVASGFFFLLFAISRGKWIGFGDVKLGAFMGFLLGWPNILVALFLAYLLGAIIGVGFIAFGKKSLKSEVPFGPLLVIGMFIAMFWSNQVIDWYYNLFLL